MLVWEQLSASVLAPFVHALLFYISVFILAEVSRKAVVYFFHRQSLWHQFFMEFIGTACMCSAVYENGVILINYGVIGFFFVVIGLLLTGAMVNRGATINPMPVIEAFYKGVISSDRLIAILSAQVMGAFASYKIAKTLWYYSMNFAPDHAQFLDNLPCSFNYHVPFYFAMCYEFLGCFLIRLLMPRLPASFKFYLFPTIISFLLSVAFVYVGVPALNPITVSARMMNCRGLDTQWFLLTYWVVPVLGWMAAVWMDPEAPVAKPQNTGGRKTKINKRR